MEEWMPGDVVAGPYSITIPPDARPGPYSLDVGMYETVSERRLPLTMADGTEIRTSLTTAELVVN